MPHDTGQGAFCATTSALRASPRRLPAAGSGNRRNVPDTSQPSIRNRTRRFAGTPNESFHSTSVGDSCRTSPHPLRSASNTGPPPSWASAPRPHGCRGRSPAADADYAQTAYEVEITTGTAQVYTVQSAEQVLVPWPGDPLASRESAQVRVRVRGDGDWSDWSGPATVEVGLLGSDDWTARFVSPRDIGGYGAPAPAARRCRSTCRTASSRPGCTRPRTASTSPSSTASGSATTSSRPAGRRTSTGCATRRTTSPTWSGRARTGSRSCSATAGTAAGSASRTRRALYGDRLALLAQLEVTTADGQVHALGTDEHLDRTRERGPRRRPVRRPAHRPAPDAGTSPTTGRRARRRPRPARRTRRAAGARHRGPARGRDQSRRRPARPWSTSARTWSAGSG